MVPPTSSGTLPRDVISVMRAVASAIILFVINLVGLGLGPQLVGILNDLLQPSFGDEAIRYSLSAMGLFNLWGALRSVLGARTLRAELADVERTE